jgi:large subunit ribosomal protein L1
VEYRLDKTSNLHIPIGKSSFSVEKLLDNFTAVVDAIKKARPPAAKGVYMRKITVTSSMGPGIKVDPMQAQALEAAF